MHKNIYIYIYMYYTFMNMVHDGACDKFNNLVGYAYSDPQMHTQPSFF